MRMVQAALAVGVWAGLACAADPQASVDRFIEARWNAARSTPSPRCSDETFIRRAFLDVVGVIPPPAEVEAFLADPAADKRDRLIDRLLADERYGRHWAVMWGDLLREQTDKRQTLFRDWLRQTLQRNQPYDRFVTDLLTASGNRVDNPATSFYLRDAGADNWLDVLNTVSQVFMGTRLSCAQCHDHFFDKWKQKDFHGFMAFLEPRTTAGRPSFATILAQLKEGSGLPDDIRAVAREVVREIEHAKDAARKQPTLVKDLTEAVRAKLGEPQAAVAKAFAERLNQPGVSDRADGEYRMPHDGVPSRKPNQAKPGDVLEPAFPWNPQFRIPAGKNRRQALALAITQNRQFAEVHVNRLWARLLGRGLVHPVDDFREKNPPSHPELLRYLADELIGSGYDTRRVLRLILTSQTYQRSAQTNESNHDDTTLFSRQRQRPLTAEQLLDSLATAAGRRDGLKGLGLPGEPVSSASAVWAADLETPAAITSLPALFGQPDRDLSCAERPSGGSIAQALALLNGPLTRRLTGAADSPMLQRLTAEPMRPAAITRSLYLAALSRPPSATELRAACGFLGDSPTADSIEDLFWALLNSHEFRYRD